MIFYFLSFLNLSLPCFLSCSYFLAKSQPGVSYKGCSYITKTCNALFFGRTVKHVILIHDSFIVDWQFSVEKRGKLLIHTD